MRALTTLLSVLCLPCLVAFGQTKKDTPDPEPTSEALSPSALAALEKLKMPGVTINVEERSVDVASSICLDEGALELIACTKDTKEHESILAIEAKAVHIHTALLLFGVKSGNPAMQKRVGEEGDGRWVHLPPSGGNVDVYLVVEGKDGKTVERPISDFIVRSEDTLEIGEEAGEKTHFPTHTFLFAGSHLVGEGDGERRYLSDQSGNVISIATFGDETLCLPDIHSHQNGALLWRVDSTDLPKVGSKVTLRLRPQVEAVEKSGADNADTESK